MGLNLIKRRWTEVWRAYIIVLIAIIVNSIIVIIGLNIMRLLWVDRKASMSITIGLTIIGLNIIRSTENLRVCTTPRRQ